MLNWCGNAHGIISGSAAEDGEFPWIAGIIKKGNYPSPALIGGGSLVGDQWVLTAAHSLDSETSGTIEVWIGMNNLSDSASRVVRNVLAIYRHPDYSSTDGESNNDLALLLLDRPVASVPVIPILDDPSGISVGDGMDVAGFGTTSAEVAAASDILMKAYAEVTPPVQGTRLSPRKIRPK